MTSSRPLPPLRPGLMVDVTAPLGPSTEAWPGDVPFSRMAREEQGFVTSSLEMSAHSGTHLDAPAHLASRSGPTVDRLPLERLLTEVLLRDTPGGLPRGEELRGRGLLLRGGCGLPPAAAARLVDAGVGVVGVDSISIDAPGSAGAHAALLGAGVPVIEGLVLSGLEEGAYMMLCLPLRIEEGEASPVRVLLQPL